MALYPVESSTIMKSLVFALLASSILSVVPEAIISSTVKPAPSRLVL